MIRLTAAACLAVCSSLQAGDVTSLLLDAQAQFQESHYEQALKLYKQAQDEAGGDASVEYNIGLCHLRLGDAGKATQHFESVASRADASATVRRDAFFNVGVIRAAAARQRLEELLHPQTEEDAEAPLPPADAPENIEDLQAIAGELLRAIALFRECEEIQAGEDAQHNLRAVRITRRNVLGLLKNAVEAKEKEEMLNDPPAYLETLIGQQRTQVGLTRYMILDRPEDAAAERQARRAILRLQRQIMERTGVFADHLAQFVESADEGQASPAEGEETPREQVYHAAAAQLERSIQAQRDASAFLMDGEIEPSFDEQVRALDEMYVALRLFPQEPQKALVKAYTAQNSLKEMVSTVESDSDWLQDAVLGRGRIPDTALLEPEKTALHYDQSQLLGTLSVLRMQCEQIAAASQGQAETEGTAEETPPQLDPELNGRLAETLADVDGLRSACLNAIAARDKVETLAVQQQILDVIAAALALLPKSIEQRIAELVARQAHLNDDVKAETGEDSTATGPDEDTSLNEIRRLAAEARSDVMGGPPSEVAERIRQEQDDIHLETDSVNTDLRQEIPSGTSDGAGSTAPGPDAQAPEVQAYIEASKHLEQADFEMLVAAEGLEKAVVQNSLLPMEPEGPVQPAQARALEELIAALNALRPPEDQSQCDQKERQDQQQQQEPEEQESQDARRAVERTDQERDQAERELYQRRPRTVIKDW